MRENGSGEIRGIIRRRLAVRRCERAFNAALTALLLVMMAIGCYAIYDNNQVYESAGAAQWKAYKPSEDDYPTFEDLVEINPEVKAWLELYGTSIDYPVCQSSGNPMKYLTTNPMGEYALSGSLFLDVYANGSFSDKATFVFGHHMDADTMFGPIDSFLDREFLDEHRYGYLHADGKDWGLEMWCAFTTSAYDRTIYRNGITEDGEYAEYLDLIRSRADVIRDIEVGVEDKIVLMSTCSSEMTDGRTVLVAKVTSTVPDNPFSDQANLGTGTDGEYGLWGVPWHYWLALAPLPILGMALLMRSIMGAVGRGKAELTVSRVADVAFVYLDHPKARKAALLGAFRIDPNVTPLGWDKAFNSRKTGKWKVYYTESDGQTTVFYKEDRDGKAEDGNDEGLVVFVDAISKSGEREAEWTPVNIPFETENGSIGYAPASKLELRGSRRETEELIIATQLSAKTADSKNVSKTSETLRRDEVSKLGGEDEERGRETREEAPGRGSRESRGAPVG